MKSHSHLLPSLLFALFLCALSTPARGEFIEHTIEIDQNGLLIGSSDYIELFITRDPHDCPPVSSNGLSDARCGSGTLDCIGNAEELATSLADGLSGCLPGVTVTSRDNLLIVINDKNVTGYDLYFCLNTLECASPYGFGLNEDCPVNNICTGICGDEAEAPGSTGLNFSLTTRLLTDVVRSDIRITRTGLVSGPGIVEYFLTEGPHPCPPVLSNGADDAVCRSGIVDMTGLTASALASSFAEGLSADPNCPTGVTVFARGSILTVLNDKSVSGRDLYHCINTIECSDPFGYGLDNCTVNNLGSGSCGDENLSPGASGFHLEHLSSIDPFSGNVNSGAGSIQDVLSINGSTGDETRTVGATLGESLSVLLTGASEGPVTANYVLWVWRGTTRNLFEANPLDLDAGGGILGTTVQPTPLHPLASPQAIRCLNGGLSPSFCGAISGLNSTPEAAPFEVTKGSGLRIPSQFTLQALIEDSGAANSQGISVTNAVSLDVR